MKTYHTTMRMIMALAIMLFPLLRVHAWEWHWTDTWNEAVAICDECGEEYTFYAEHTSDAEEIAAGFFCEGCGSCIEDVNLDCFNEHHCLVCYGCISDGDYHEGWYNKYGDRICNDCFDVLSEGADDVCEFCHELFGADVTECTCEMGNLKLHCTDCTELACEICGNCMIVAGEELDVVGDACVEHAICNECMEAAAAEDDIHCRLCLHCDEDVCEVCGLCESCASGETHCPECGHCFDGDIQFCDYGGQHCNFCCIDNDWTCELCGKCIESLGISLCDDCGLCEDCCHDFSESSGCDHGYCIASYDFEDHLCPGCGQCPQDEECEYCGLCLECQADHHCEHGLCPDGSDWEAHVCPDCGDCFEDSELCVFCGLCENCWEHCEHGFCPESDDQGDHFICEQCGDCYEGDDQCDVCELCLDCCHDNISEKGCEHDFCIESDDFAEHWCYEDDQCLEFCQHDEGCEHPDVSTAWSKDGNAHWHVCIDCGKAIDKAIHTEGAPVILVAPNPSTRTNGTAQVSCTVCNYNIDIVSIPYVEATSDGKPYIITQPTDYTGKVSEYEGPRAEAAGGVLTRYATFKVYAGGEDLQYQWWQKWNKDPDTSWMPAEGVDGSENAPTLKVEMNIEECNGNFYRQFKCDVFNEIDNVTTNVANLKPKHVFGFYYGINDETHGYYCVGGCGERLRTSKHRFNDWTLVKPATSDETGLREQVCRDCSFAISEVIPKVEPNHVHSFDVARHSLTQHWFVCRCGVIGPDPKEDHNFDETEVVTEPTEKRMGESNLICSACGYYKTVKTDKLPHVHDYYSINDEGMFITKNGKYVPDPQKCKRGPLSHSFKCKGCDEWEIENHTWEMWLCARAPKSADEPGRMVRHCQTCYYEETKFFPYGSYPVMIEGGTADRDYAKEGDIVTIQYNPESARKMYYTIGGPVKFVMWYDAVGFLGDNNSTIDWGSGYIELPRLTFMQPTTSTATFRMKNGPAAIFAFTEECDHTGGTIMSGRVEPTCNSHGHEPHTLCADCHEILVEGATIPALGHDLPSTPNPGTEIVEYCTEIWNGRPAKPNDAKYGFEGYYTCRRCNEEVKGKRTPLKHGCYHWGTGKVTNDWNTEGEIYTTCTKDGYTGDDYCGYCGKLAYKGEIVHHAGHKWGEWETIREATTKIKGMERHTCIYCDAEETRVTDYSGPDYTIKPDKSTIRFEWVFGEEPPSQTITFRSIGRNKVHAITKLDFSSYADNFFDYTFNNMSVTITPKPVTYSIRCGVSELDEVDIVQKVLTDEGEVVLRETPCFTIFRKVNKTPEKYTLTVEDGLAATATPDEYGDLPPKQNSSWSKKLLVRGGQVIMPEPEEEWQDDFLRWEIVGNNKGLEHVQNSSDKNAFFIMPCHDVTIRAVYKKKAASMAFSEKIVRAGMGTVLNTPKLQKSPGNIAVTYKSSDESVARVDALTGTPTILREGSATIIATFAGNAHYTSARTTYLLTTSRDELVAYDLAVSGVGVYNINKHDILGDGKVRYNPMTQTLTLDNAYINTTEIGVEANMGTMKVELLGSNTIIANDNTYGMNIRKTADTDNVTFYGGGSLYIRANLIALQTTANLVLTDGVSITAEGIDEENSFGFRGQRSGSVLFPTLTMKGNETMLRAKGGWGSFAYFEGISLNDGIQIIEPVGAFYAEKFGVVNNDHIVAGEWVTFARQDYIDGIESLTPTLSDDEGTYNLAGQRVGKDYKGIVIEGGKKTLRK